MRRSSSGWPAWKALIKTGAGFKHFHRGVCGAVILWSQGGAGKHKHMPAAFDISPTRLCFLPTPNIFRESAPELIIWQFNYFSFCFWEERSFRMKKNDTEQIVCIYKNWFVNAFNPPKGPDACSISRCVMAEAPVFVILNRLQMLKESRVKCKRPDSRPERKQETPRPPRTPQGTPRTSGSHLSPSFNMTLLSSLCNITIPQSSIPLSIASSLPHQSHII